MATLTVGVAGYAVTVLAGHALTPDEYQRFTVYWGLFFACTGVLDGLMQETARSVTAARLVGDRVTGASGGSEIIRPQHPARPALFGVTVALGVTALVLGTAPLWAVDLFGGHGALPVPLLAAGLASYAVQATLCGLLSAHRRWRTYAWLISADSVVRVILAAAALAAGWHFTAFLLVTVVGAASWLLTVLTDVRGCRRLVRAVADVSPTAFARRCGAAMLASGANALLIAGFPVLLTATSRDNPAPGTLAALITAVTLSRAPLLVPLQRFIPALVVSFTRNRQRLLPVMAPVLGYCTGAAVAGGLLARVLAAPLVSLFFPADLVAAPETYGVLTLASGSLAVLTVTGAAALGSGWHGVYVAGWFTATVIAVALLSTGWPPVVRTASALGVAPLCGAAVHLWSVRVGGLRQIPA